MAFDRTTIVISPTIAANMITVFFLRIFFNCMEGNVLRVFYANNATALLLRPFATRGSTNLACGRCTSYALFLDQSLRRKAPYHRNAPVDGLLTTRALDPIIAGATKPCQNNTFRAFVRTHFSI